LIADTVCHFWTETIQTLWPESTLQITSGIVKHRMASLDKTTENGTGQECAECSLGAEIALCRAYSFDFLSL